jgi:deoxycytidylate deaminase
MTYISPKPYPYLPEGRTLLYVPETNTFMQRAKELRLTLSTDQGHPIGAVIVKDGAIIGEGANQSALKSKFLREIHKKYFCVRRILNIPSGQKYWLCPGCASFRNHSEAVTVKNALSKNKTIEGADLYMYGHWWCCEPCWEQMISAGIKNVYLPEGATELFS